MPSKRLARLRSARPLWLARSSPGPPARYPTLRGCLDVDVAVVGAGITGALTAYELATAGASVALVDAHRIGCGSTAASSALLLREPDRELQELAAMYGGASARRIWQLSADAARRLIDRLRSLRIDCALEISDTVYYATGADQVGRLKREHQRRVSARLGGAWLTPRRVREHAGLPGHAAIVTAGAHFDPYAACVGLVKAAAKAGVAVLEQSPIVRTVRHDGQVRLHSRHGLIRAPQVIIATGYATREFRPLVGRFALSHTYVLATRPLDADERREVGLRDVMVWESGRPYHYARWTADRRLLLGGADRPVRPGATRAARLAGAERELRGHFERLLPALAGVRTDRIWEGLFAMTADSLPYIGPHPRYPRHGFALGYGGNGMTFAALAARILVEQWRGVRSADHALFGFGREARQLLP